MVVRGISGERSRGVGMDGDEGGYRSGWEGVGGSIRSWGDFSWIAVFG